MTTQRLKIIQIILKVMEMTEFRGGDYKDHSGVCSDAMPEELPGLGPMEERALHCGSDCPRAFEDLLSNLEDEFEKAGCVVVFTEKELRILQLQKELRALRK